ncbi:MAG: hypothetical protein KatS3mg068_1163 [Candidatus Sericytochromatia bacterium]|nr:MAG: hypothetical protein KatS3mg068_1163 [Candidatus Sericytochromatia bacterium]
MSIEAKNLLKIYGKRKVVNDVTINVERGEVVGLLGPNGAGKTTTFYMVVGLIKPNKGIITVDNKNISKEPMYKRARLGLGYLPQEASVFRKLTVEENILAIWQLRGGAPKLSIKEKIELIFRKSERTWWRRPKFENYYNLILNEDKLNNVQKEEIKSIIDNDLINKYSNIKYSTEILYSIFKIIELLELNVSNLTQEIESFFIDFNKFYKLGKKKKLEEFLNLLWKKKRDELFESIKISNNKKDIIKKIPFILDYENPEVFNKIEEDNISFSNINQFIDYLNSLENYYWNIRKKCLNQDKFIELNNSKKSDIKNDLKDFMLENNFKNKEIEDILSIINWTSKESKFIQLEDILDEFNISHIRYSKGSDLSGGERRRVEIARAVSVKPSFLLLDEPFAGIDPIAVAGIKEMIVLLKNRNIGVLITDHNVRETLKIIDRGYILSDGRVIESGSREHLANSEIARKHYLGEDFTLN